MMYYDTSMIEMEILSKSSTYKIRYIKVIGTLTRRDAMLCIGPSMQPTIEEQDILLCESISIILGRIKRGDVVVCFAPITKSETEDDSPKVERQSLCKRVVGLSGDWVEQEGFQYRIAKGFIWIEGDNSKNSWDSRYFGPVPITDLRRKCFAKIYPRFDATWARTSYQKSEDSDAIVIKLN